MQLNGGFYGGAIATIDRQRGVNGQDALRDVTPVKQRVHQDAAWFARCQEGPANLVPDRPVVQVDRPKAGPGWGPYNTPGPIDDRYYLCTKWRGSGNGAVVLRTYDNAVEIPLLTRAAGDMEYWFPEPLVPRPVPPVHPSVLPKNAEPWGTLFLHDVYRGLEPQVNRGEVKQLAVVEVLPMPTQQTGTPAPGLRGSVLVTVSCGATLNPKRVWGFVPVAEDGSAYFQVPADRPVYFLALDAQGRAVQRMRSFTHLRAGEVQGCVGCHEPRLHTAMADRPIPAAALRKPAARPQPPDWGVMGFCYSRIVQPVLDAHCVSCHNARQRPKGLDLTGDKTDQFNISYNHLAFQNHAPEGAKPAGAWVNWIPTADENMENILVVEPRSWGSPRSPLADLVLSGHPDPEGKPRVKLSDAERARILTWIDLNVPYYGTGKAANSRAPGGRYYHPKDLAAAYDEVSKRRCASCHGRGAPHAGVRMALGREGGTGPSFLRLTHPEQNGFLAAPLATSAGGWQRCGEPVFKSQDDPDYRKLLATFQPILAQWKVTPREDLSEATTPEVAAFEKPEARRDHAAGCVNNQ
jgi:mono/diheme cytochrome c family protein